MAMESMKTPPSDEGMKACCTYVWKKYYILVKKICHMPN